MRYEQRGGKMSDIARRRKIYGRMIAEVENAGHDVGGRKAFQEAQLPQR